MSFHSFVSSVTTQNRVWILYNIEAVSQRQCSGLYRASVRTGDLLGYFLLSLTASPTIINLFFLLSVLPLLLFITGLHHNCRQNLSISLWRLLTLPICSGKRGQNANPAEELSSILLNFTAHGQTCLCGYLRPRYMAASRTDIRVRLNLEPPCVSWGHQEGSTTESAVAGAAEEKLQVYSNISWQECRREREESVPAVHWGKWIEGDFYMLPQCSTGSTQSRTIF